MKREAFLWALTVTAGAAPLLSWKQGSAFDYPGLRFDYDKKFRITMFNDLHLGDQGRPNSDDKTLGVMNNVLNAESGTDLVVLNGDLTSCEWIGPQDVNGTIDKIINPLINRNIPFAATFGNHDMSATCNTRSISEYIWNAANKNGHQLTWTTSTVEGDYNHVGTSNYYIPIYGSRGGGNPKLKMILWFFDSKGGRQYQPGGPNVPVADWVDDKVVSWFKLTRDQIQNDHTGQKISSLAFVHIPPSVTRAFQKSGDLTSTTEPGLNEEIIGAQADSNEGADSPFMQALVDTNGLIAVFSGHDHGIDWCMKWSATKAVPGNNPGTGNNINLCFGRHTGYGGYSDWMRGGRHIVIEEDRLGQDNVLETWIRLEDGEISGRVNLNSTYGSDNYPEVDRKETHLDLSTEGLEAERVNSMSTSTAASQHSTTVANNLNAAAGKRSTTVTSRFSSQTDPSKPITKPNPEAKTTHLQKHKPSSKGAKFSLSYFSSPWLGLAVTVLL